MSDPSASPGPEALGRRLVPLPETALAAAAEAAATVALERLFGDLAAGVREAADRPADAAATGSAPPSVAAFAPPDSLPALAGIAASGPYLADLMLGDPTRLARVLAEPPEAGVARLVARAAEPQATEAALMRHLRRIKNEAALVIALADLGGVWDLDAVTGALTAVADAAVAAAVRFLLAAAGAEGKLAVDDAADPARGSGYIVLAMGKHGAGELNYSSDIDLVVFFERGKAARVGEDKETTFFVKLTQRLVKILQERTGDGYVFRTDLRLRPDPGATAIAVSVPAALAYYESVGQNWERAAFIKARPCAGDIAAGEAFLAEIAPFIWRRSLDYAAIADIHSIKRQIHAAKGHGVVAVAGHDLKLGRGGIREVEFFVQTQQLVAGGREPRLRGRRTREMLATLAELGWIEAKARDHLDAAYVFLRTVEHRLQMVADQQTHRLPLDGGAIANVARMARFAEREAFEDAVRRHLERVQRHYARLFEDAPPLAASGGSLVFTGHGEDPDTVATLRSLGFADPSRVIRIVGEWHHGRYPATRSQASRERLTEIVPALLAAFAANDNADQALIAFDHLLSQLPTGLQLFSILRSNPTLIGMLGVVLAAAPPLAGTIARRPRVLGAVIAPTFFGSMPDRAELGRRLDRFLADARSYEDSLDRARIFGQEHACLVGVRVISGTIAAGDAGLAYATLAEVLVDRLLAAARSEFESRHGRVAGGAVAVVALGKLGGREMTAASDLDLIVVYDHDAGAEASDGPRPLAPSQYYARLTQRLVAALSAPTAEGRLYAVDFRLRPSGHSGPLASSLASFAHYQEREAWTWEHMAMTRARVVAGDAALADRVRRVLAAVVARPRDRRRLADEVRAMRHRIEQEKRTLDPFEIKQVAGGLVDVEFVAQFMLLAHGRHEPALIAQSTDAILSRLAARGFLGPEHAEILLPAIRLYQALTQVMRLAVDGRFKPEEAPREVLGLLTRAGEAEDFAALTAKLVATEAAVRAVFTEIVGPVEAVAGTGQGSEG